MTIGFDDIDNNEFFISGPETCFDPRMIHEGHEGHEDNSRKNLREPSCSSWMYSLDRASDAARALRACSWICGFKG